MATARGDATQSQSEPQRSFRTMEIGTDLDAEVLTIGEARAALNSILARFRTGDGHPVVVGPHRHPQAVVIPLAEWRRLTAGEQP